MSNARDYALLLLDQKALPNWPARRLPRKIATGIAEPADPRDRALAEQIDTGVTKNLLQLQYLIEQIAGRPLAKIHPVIQKILAIGIYQLRFLDRIRPAAAVNEGVEQAKRLGLAHTRGFVNAVLRKAAASAKEAIEEFDTYEEDARILHSHPPELYSRLEALLNEERAIEICRHNNSQPPTIARLAPGRTIDDLESAGIAALSHHLEGMVVLISADKATISRMANLQLAQVQDPTSALVVNNADIKPGMSVLDRCCGMGTKTIQAWELAGPSASIVAIDPAPSRCEALRRTVLERNIGNIRVIQSDSFPRRNPDVPQQYDRVIVDVPCSNSGVLARRPEARYHQSNKHLEDLIKLQKAILADTIPAVAPGGLLIYSTCSIWSEENQQIVQWILNEFEQLDVIRDHTTLPHSSEDPADYHDGGYYAILKRTK